MTVDEFNLLVRSMHREWTQNPKNISFQGSSTYFGGAGHVSIFIASDCDIWLSIGQAEYRIQRSSSLWGGKEKKKFDDAMNLLYEIRSGIIRNSAEELICKHIPAAKEIIAEMALVNDHKD